MNEQSIEIKAEGVEDLNCFPVETINLLDKLSPENEQLLYHLLTKDPQDTDTYEDNTEFTISIPTDTEFAINKVIKLSHKIERRKSDSKDGGYTYHVVDYSPDYKLGRGGAATVYSDLRIINLDKDKKTVKIKERTESGNQYVIKRQVIKFSNNSAEDKKEFDELNEYFNNIKHNNIPAQIPKIIKDVNQAYQVGKRVPYLHMKEPVIRFNENARTFESITVMRLMKGITLEKLLKYVREGIVDLTADQRISLCLAIIKGLQLLHNYGIIHCDVKPANIIVDIENQNNPIVKFIDTDYGYISEMQDDTPCAGTLGYASPEIGNDRPKKSIDVFSVNEVLKEVCGDASPNAKFIAISAEKLKIISSLYKQKFNKELSGALLNQCKILIDTDTYKQLLSYFANNQYEADNQSPESHNFSKLFSGMNDLSDADANDQLLRYFINNQYKDKSLADSQSPESHNFSKLFPGMNGLSTDHQNKLTTLFKQGHSVDPDQRYSLNNAYKVLYKIQRERLKKKMKTIKTKNTAEIKETYIAAKSHLHLAQNTFIDFITSPIETFKSWYEAKQLQKQLKILKQHLVEKLATAKIEHLNSKVYELSNEQSPSAASNSTSYTKLIEKIEGIKKETYLFKVFGNKDKPNEDQSNEDKAKDNKAKANKLRHVIQQEQLNDQASIALKRDVKIYNKSTCLLESITNKAKELDDNGKENLAKEQVKLQVKLELKAEIKDEVAHRVGLSI